MVVGIIFIVIIYYEVFVIVFCIKNDILYRDKNVRFF